MGIEPTTIILPYLYISMPSKILLSVSGNEITDITGDNWLGLENSLQTLILAENSIASLPLDAFSGLLVLETLDLHGNHLSVIDSGVFRDGMSRLHKVRL